MSAWFPGNHACLEDIFSLSRRVRGDLYRRIPTDSSEVISVLVDWSSVFGVRDISIERVIVEFLVEFGAMHRGKALSPAVTRHAKSNLKCV